MEEGDSGYEIMPYKEIVALKKQIEELRQRTGDTDSRQLLVSMANLTKSMSNMLQLFKTAAEEMKLEQREEEAIGKKIGPLVEKVNELGEQNKTIAEGMVAIADMVREMKGEKKPSFEKPEPRFESLPFEKPEQKFSEQSIFDVPDQFPQFPEHGAAQQPIKPVRFVPPRKPFAAPGPMPPPGMPPGPGFGPEPFPPFEEPFPSLGKPKKRGFLGVFKKK